MKAKPLSIRHRFVLWQASTFALALGLLAGAVFINLKIRHEMEEPLQDLKANLQIVSVLHDITQAHLKRFEPSLIRLREYTRWVYLLLAVFGLLAVLALLQCRRLHRRELWQPRAMEDSLEHKVRERTAKLEAVQRELVQAAKLSNLGQLVSGVTHEINSPLTSILGFTELALARRDLDRRLRTQLQTVRDEAMRLRRLVANLRVLGQRTLLQTARVDLRAVLDCLVDLYQSQLHSTNIELHFERPAWPVWVAGDPDQLVEAFSNLVLNAQQAIQSCRNGGDIWLACGIEDGHAWGTVRDNGPGMSKEVLGRIFDPFFTTKPVGQGAGLGLSISYAIIQQHQGTITAESAEGQGATLHITLPSAEPLRMSPELTGSG